MIWSLLSLKLEAHTGTNFMQKVGQCFYNHSDYMGSEFQDTEATIEKRAKKNKTKHLKK